MNKSFQAALNSKNQFNVVELACNAPTPITPHSFAPYIGRRFRRNYSPEPDYILSQRHVLSCSGNLRLSAKPETEAKIVSCTSGMIPSKYLLMASLSPYFSSMTLRIFSRSIVRGSTTISAQPIDPRTPWNFLL